MENLQGGLTARHWGCGLASLVAGIVAGPFGPIVGGMVTTSCFLLNSEVPAKPLEPIETLTRD